MSQESLLLSIKPKWCQEIITGHKTLECRKTLTKLKPPFKCVVYCTKDKNETLVAPTRGGDVMILNGKVIGEFTCDSVEETRVPFPDAADEMDETVLERSCVSYMELHEYVGRRPLYCYGIKDFQLYKIPKKLEDYGITTAPQSFRYVQ